VRGFFPLGSPKNYLGFPPPPPPTVGSSSPPPFSPSLRQFKPSQRHLQGFHVDIGVLFSPFPRIFLENSPDVLIARNGALLFILLQPFPPLSLPGLHGAEQKVFTFLGSFPVRLLSRRRTLAFTPPNPARTSTTVFPQTSFFPRYCQHLPRPTPRMFFSPSLRTPRGDSRRLATAVIFSFAMEFFFESLPPSLPQPRACGGFPQKKIFSQIQT